MADKARITYAEFVAQRKVTVYAVGTIAWLIQRYIEDMASPEMAPLGASKVYSLRVIQRADIGHKIALELKKSDLIEFARLLRKKIKPQTIAQYFSFMRSVFNHASFSWSDCENLTIAPFLAAHPFLKDRNLISKSARRTRRPSDEEITALLNFYAVPNKRGKKRQIRMAEMIAFALVSSRRMGEICRITHGDVDYEKQIYWVRDCKHPTKKKGNDKSFVLWPELETIIRRQPRLTQNPDERIFPFNAKSSSASYTNAKKALGIPDLHFHDNRGDAISKWLLKMPVGDVRKLVSGHDNDKTIEKHYDRRDTLEIMRAKYEDRLVRPAA